MDKKKKSLLLTFDVEEIESFSEARRFLFTQRGTTRVLTLLDSLNVSATFFVTGQFASENPALVQEISKQGHEVASHGLEHVHNYKRMNSEQVLCNLEKARNILEQIVQRKVLGFRAPRLMFPSYRVIKSAGFIYDASLHPTFVPGKYNHFFAPRSAFHSEGIVVIPVSVTPFLRLPFSWIWFRNFGPGYSRFCTWWAGFNRSYIQIYFHPWEFEEIRNSRINVFMRRRTGGWLESSLNKYIVWAKEIGFRTETIQTYLKRTMSL